MNQTLKTILIAAGVAILIVVGIRLVGNNQPQPVSDGLLGATNGMNRFPNGGIAAHWLKLDTNPAGDTAGADGSLSVSGATTFSGTVALSSTLSLGGTGTTLSKIVKQTASYNPPSLAQNATTTTTLAFTTTTGLPAVGTPCTVGLASHTTSQAWLARADITALDANTASSTVTIQNLAATLDDATGTLTVTCFQ